MNYYQKLFEILQSQGHFVGEADLSGQHTKIVFSLGNYTQEHLDETWKKIQSVFNESINIEYSSVGIILELIPILYEDEPTEIQETLDESSSRKIELTRKSKVLKNQHVTTHKTRPISERFGFIL